MSEEDVQYLQQHHVPALFAELVRHLLEKKPSNIAQSLQHYLVTKQSTPEERILTEIKKEKKSARVSITESHTSRQTESNFRGSRLTRHPSTILMDELYMELSGKTLHQATVPSRSWRLPLQDRDNQVVLEQTTPTTTQLTSEVLGTYFSAKVEDTGDDWLDCPLDSTVDLTSTITAMSELRTLSLRTAEKKTPLMTPLMQGKLKFPTKSDVCKSVDELIEEAIDDNALELNLEDCKLTVVPELPILESLCILYLSNNDLTHIPDDTFNYVQSLERLYLGNNKLVELPLSIFTLPHLLLLDANNNKLSTIDSDLSCMLHLEILVLDFNNIRVIPNIAPCRSLTKLYILNNLDLEELKVDTVLGAFRLRPNNLPPLQLGLDNHPNLMRQMADQPHIEAMWNKIYADAILPGKLFLGSLRTAQNETAMGAFGIRSVLTVGRDLKTPEYLTQGFDQKRFQVDDNDGTNLEENFEEAVIYIREAMKRGAVLVHCFAGMSRSATVVIAYLMMEEHMRFDEAYNFTRKCRPVIYPNNGFVKQLVTLDRKLYGNNERPLDMDSLERHLVPT